MFEHCGKRVLAFFLAMVMIFSAVPVQVFAEEFHDHEGEELAAVSETVEEHSEGSNEEPVEGFSEESDEEPSEEVEEEPVEEVLEEIIEEPVVTETVVAEQLVESSDLENEALVEIQSTIDEMLTYYLGTTTATVEEIEAAVDAMDSDTIWMAQVEIYDLEEKISETLTEAEAEALVESNTVMCDFSAILGKYHAGPNLLAETLILDGEIKVYAKLGSITVSGNTVTITNKISGISFGTKYEFVITNTSGKSGTLQFDYNGNTFDSFGLSSKTGTYPATLLKDGEQIKITASSKCGFGGQNDKLILSNIVFTPQEDSYETEFVFDASLGSVTVDGNTVASGDKMQIMAEGATLATTNSNFLGWIDDNSGKILSTDKSFRYEPTDALTVRPVFTSSDPWFQVNKQDGNYLFKGWEVATAAAAGATNKAFALANNATLPAGKYTIPSGVTLLIPFNDANTLYTTAPGTVDGQEAPTAYRKLTMASGAVLNVKGSLSISGDQSHKQGYNGRPNGKVGWITMEKDSQIIVDGNLYAWGIVDGSGTVTVNSTATAYECFYITDWRGGSAGMDMIGNDQGVFPMDQYTIPNVMVPMTIHAGAKEYGYMSVNISYLGVQASDVPFINNSNGMFRITRGSITKWNDGTRMYVEVNGDLSVSPLKVSVSYKSIDSKDYYLPINNKLSVVVKEGSNIQLNQDLALLPGSELIIDSGANATLGSGNRIVIYDAEDFKGAYVWNHAAVYSTEDAKVVVNGTADLSAGAAYTTAKGANISGNGTIIVDATKSTLTKTYQYNQSATTYEEIAVTPGVLQNSDSTVTATAGAKGKVIYKSVDGVWTCEHTYATGTYQEKVTTPATCEAKGLKTLTCNCGGHSKTEEIAALGHDYEAKVTAPTCTEAGYTTHTCKNDATHTYTDSPVVALGHTAGEAVKENEKAATCSAAGSYDSVVYCSVCGAEQSRETVPVDALPHTAGEAVVENKVDATCTADGSYDSVVYCSVCDAEMSRNKETVTSTGHNYNPVVTDPTCTEKGYTTHTCTVCGDSYTDAETDAAGHKYEWVTDEEATVLLPGVKHEECSVCHEKRNENTEIPVLKCSHTGTMESTKAVAATCTEAGNSAYWYCSACQNYYSDAAGQHEIEKDSWILPALKHSYGEATYTWINENQEVTAKRVCKNDASHTETETVTASYAVVTEADCETVGAGKWTSAAFANSAFAVQTKEIEIPSVGHSYGEATYTWSEDNKTVTAERVCANDASHKETETAEAVYAVVKAADCETVGAGKWTSAAFANKAFAVQTKEVEIPAAGHTEVEHEAKAPTCTEKGWNAYVTCENCDYTTYEEIPAKGHGTLAFIERHEPTCQKDGNVAYWTCLVCKTNFADEEGKTVLETVIIPVKPDAHSFAAEGEETKATCQAEGKIVYPCNNEGCEETKTEILPIDPEAHVWDEGEPYKIHSCNSASYMKYECTLCDAENLVVVREQHFRVPIAEEIPATCTEDGMTSGWKCEQCDEFWIPQEVIPALGHDWNGAYPCEHETSACTRCGLSFSTKQEHKTVVTPGTPATCTTPGLTDGESCEYCGKVIVAQTEIPVTEHDWIVTDMEIPATCDSVGHKEGARYCLDCDYDADPIPQLTHEWMHRDAKKATYSAIGWNAHDYCILCNATKTLEQFESDPCEFCGENPQEYIEIPMVEIQKIETFDEYLANLGYLEALAAQYALEHPGTDPLGLVLNYLRTGVANYTSGSWAIMAGPEDTDFKKFVQDAEDAINADPEVDVMVNLSGLKKIKNYKSPTGEQNIYNKKSLYVISGHLYGTMDMTYHNKGSQNHADVGGWVGDTTDLLSTTDEYGVPANLTLEEKIAYITKEYLFKENVAGAAGSFGSNDLYSDLDGYYFMNELITKGYQTGDLAKLMGEYYKSNLTLKQRFSYLMNNRLDGLSTRQDLRTAVYNAYTSNKLIATLEGTRNFKASGNELAELRKAVCYAFADEMCRRAGDYVENLTNPRFTIFDTETKILAPGVSQQINYATNADGKQIVYYVATADVNREDVGLWVNYYDRDPGTPEAPIWKNNSVPSSAQNAQDRYGDPNSPDYIENFNVIASTNAGGYDMSDVATPGGLMVMNGVEWHPQSNNAGFFAILDDGTAYMGTHDEYEAMMAAGRIKEAIGGFGEFVVQNGEVTGSATYSDAPRTSVGITATGRVVIMCIDGRQAPFSSGASLQDEGYIMKEAGCVVAINLDGGGSTTFVARQPGSDELTVMNRPSDGYPRNVSTNLLIYSTAPSSTKFDHAVIESEYDHATIGTPVQMTAAGVSPAGNAVDVPEGAVWSVGNEDWASITEDGVFTGKRLGEVYVYLTLDGVEIGSKLMTLTNPDQVYFERAKVDAILGSSVNLPLRARVDGKPIAINPDDVTFTVSAPAAGAMDGFVFQAAAESTVKALSITAALSSGSNATINVLLYKQGENSFDFEKATGGDRTLAWHREVSNAKVEDGNIYNVIDPAKDMVTSYTFAMDMTTIPIPERISELTYMLPGGTMEGATAWSFLLSLAQRISDMSWVQATIDFDDRFDVDYSELKILNEYFIMKGEPVYDAETNSLTVTMNWKRQSQVIDEATANPLCLITGFKLTPKEGAWAEDVTKIDAVTSGKISYEIYMRASGLYSFAQKPESQAVFGIYPYRNPADTTDAGGYFRDTYAEITDTYTLVNVLKEGWVNEDGGFAYYVNGERLTGVQQVEGFYYDFGEAGVNVGQTKYTGIFLDTTANVYRFSYIGELADGWQSVGDDWYYFKNFEAVSGVHKVGGVSYEFEENGKLVSGKWVSIFTGWRYYYGPSYYQRGWYNIDGEWYYFLEGTRVTGITKAPTLENVKIIRWFDFGEDGVSRGMYSGFLTLENKLYFCTEGAIIERGLFKWEGDHYYARYDGSLIVNDSYYAWLIDSTSELPVAWYDFGPDGRLLGGNTEQMNGIVEKNGILYYYENGKPTEKGLFLHTDGYYYNARYDGRLIVNQVYYAWLLDSSCELPMANYEFGPDGRMYNGIVEKNGILYYYENGKAVEKGLFQLDGEYYNAAAGGRLTVSQNYYVWNISEGVGLDKGYYEFGADGRMLQGIVNKSGVLYYYINGKPTEMGLFYENGFHYYAQYDGRLIVNQKYYAWKLHSSSQLPIAHYEFGEDGRVLGSCDGGEITNKNGILYYYEDGKPTEKGLFIMDGYYYYSQWDGKLITSQNYYAWKVDPECDLPVGHYEFDEGGRMLQGIVNKSGVLYYYVNGKATEMGLFKLGNDYYYSRYDGRLVVNDKYYAWLLDESSDLPVGHYEFGADGRMVQGIVVKNGVKYFYENGNPTEKGLFQYEGNYYYSQYDGRLILNQKYYAWKTDASSELPIAYYEFDVDGKVIGASLNGEIIEKNGVYYYYEAGKPVEKGLFLMDGYYYFAHVGGKLITNQYYYVWNGNDLLLERWYTFNELGQIIG